MPTELPNVANFVARAAAECGLEREKFIDSNIPNDFNKIAILMFFGDYRGLSVLSTVLLKQYKETILKDKYLIVCSFPGMGVLFPGADEYWSISDGLSISGLLHGANKFSNSEKKVDSLERELRRRFYTVITGEDLLAYYKDGLTNQFFERLGSVKRSFPTVPHWRGGELQKVIANRGEQGIFIYPNVKGMCWDRNREASITLPKDFWIKLTDRLLVKKYVPVVYQNQASYDISPQFGEKCVYCTDRNFLSVLAAMRSTGCVLDVFSGISRMAMVARCPFLALDERQRYVKSNEAEINDLCINGMYPYRYIFSFPTVIGSDHYAELIDQIMNVSSSFIPLVAKASLPPPTESYEEVPYDIVRKHKAKKLGIHFIKVERLVIQ